MTLNQYLVFVVLVGFAVAVTGHNFSSTFDIRLANGTNNSSGRVEVFYEGQWGTLCADSWRSYEALVACRMLGFSYGLNVGTAFFGTGFGSPLMEIECDSTEQNLENCSISGWGIDSCNQSGTAGVICFSTEKEKDFDVRLTGDPGPHVGRVEVYFAGYWGTVCDFFDWDNKNANVTCRMLGYSNGRRVFRTNRYGNLTEPVWMEGVQCNGTEESLASCSFHGWGQVHSCENYPANVFCYNTTVSTVDIRLVDKLNSSAGRLEIYYGGHWGTVCSAKNTFNDSDATVACRMLHYSSGKVLEGWQGVPNEPIWMANLGCSGTEANLADCPFDGWGVVSYCDNQPRVLCFNESEIETE